MPHQEKSRKVKVAPLPHEKALLEERPRVRFKRAFFSFFVVMVILSAVYMTTPLSRLGVVYFDGLNMLTRSDLISLIDINADELFLSIRLSDIRTSVEEHPMVKQVNVARSWINRIRIEVTEYEVAACALIEGEMFHILTDGVIFHENIGMRANCNKIMIHGVTQDELEEGVLSLFVRQLMRVDQEIRDLIQLIEHDPLYGDIHRFSLSLIDGNTVKTTSHTMADQLNLYLIIIANVEPERTGILHLDVGPVFELHE